LDYFLKRINGLEALAGSKGRSRDDFGGIFFFLEKEMG
jgi:hypothetical protein